MIGSLAAPDKPIAGRPASTTANAVGETRGRRQEDEGTEQAQNRGDHGRGARECDHAHDDLGDIADRLGETQDVDVDLIVNEGCPHRSFEPAGDVKIAHSFRRLGRGLDQLGADQGRGEFVGD